MLLLCLAMAARLHGQDKHQVAPPSKSDTFAGDGHGKRFRVQHREIAGTNFQIAGVDLTAKEEVLDQAARILGKVETVATGDASEFLERACYRSTVGNDSTRLIFVRGEVSPYFVLSSESSAWTWKTPCKRSPKITRNIATTSGLHLGQTQEQVIAILGLPTRLSQNAKNGRDNLVYSLEARKKTDPGDLAIMLQEEMQKSQSLTAKEKEYLVKDFHENYDFYDLSVDIDAKFINNALIKLEVFWSATY